MNDKDIITEHVPDPEPSNVINFEDFVNSIPGEDPVPEQEQPAQNIPTPFQRLYINALNNATTVCIILSAISTTDSTIARKEKMLSAITVFTKDLRKYIKDSMPNIMAVVKEAEDAQNSSALPEQTIDNNDIPQE